MELFKRLRGGADSNSKPASVPPSQTERPSRLERPFHGGARQSDMRIPDLDSRTHMRRELLRMLTRDTQRFAGIPENWIESHVMLEPMADGSTVMHLRLTLKHWDAGFMKYLVAFQRRLMGEVERYESDARTWVASISWTLALDDVCPERELPPPGTWGAAAPAIGEIAAPPPAKPVDEVEEDLAKFFAVRDAHMGQTGNNKR